MSTSLISPQTFDPTFVVEGISTTPPVDAPNNQMWLVASAGATGPWTGKEDHVAIRRVGQVWTFVYPGNQDTAFDKTNAIYYRFGGSGWAVTTDFNQLGTSTELTSAYFSQTVNFDQPAPQVYDFQTGAPLGVYRFDTAAGASNIYSITIKDAVVIHDIVVHQNTAAGGPNCKIDVIGPGPANLVPQFTCSQTNKAILRPTETSFGVIKLAAGDGIGVNTTDVGGHLPACTVFITFSQGV
tara:strand:+ start:116 stop:835 length:720 start_codon:yes stop_codon:yes gene_type:complete